MLSLLLSWVVALIYLPDCISGGLENGCSMTNSKDKTYLEKLCKITKIPNSVKSQYLPCNRLGIE